MMRFHPRQPQDQPADLTALHPYEGVVARLLHARGVRTAGEAEAFLHPDLSMLHDPLLLSGMEDALRILAKAKAERTPTVVYGDYDVDGICATSILTHALRRYGIDAATHLPLRAEGYGLNCDAVRELAKTYRLLVTVDLGITNHEEVRLAQSLGMTVIVTDHHGLGLEMSPADVAINPLLGGYPFPRLCGAGVAFKLATALLGLENCYQYLDLAALATVADIVPLRDENRVIVSCGLPVIAAAKRPGIKALLAVCGEPNPITSETLGFQLGPRINAAGRLGDANEAVRLLLTEDAAEADRLARRLDDWNTQRKNEENRLVNAAGKAAEEHDFSLGKALIISGDNWHTGVIGLAAGRLCTRYSCPVCVLSREDGMLHGSLRSVPGVHIHDCLKECDDLLTRYGGHEQAAGVTLPAENEEAFRRRLEAAVAKYDESLFQPAQLYDEEVTLPECTRELEEMLRLLAPFGCENPAPLLLVKDALPVERRAVGAEGAHLKLSLRQGERILPGIGFSMGSMAARLPDRVDAVFSLELNEFRGQTSLQAQVKALRPVRQAQLDALSRPDGDPAGEHLLEHLLGGFSLKAGKEAPEGEYGYVQANIDQLMAAAAEAPRGLLVLAHSNAAALRLLQSCPELDLCDYGTPDVRCFATLMHRPRWECITGHWRQVYLADGEAFPGEAALLSRQLPDAQIHVLPRSRALAALMAALDAGDDAFRELYRALRRVAFRSAAEAAAYTGLTLPQTLTGLNAFHQLGLIDYAPAPFGYTVLPPVKCSLGDSPLLGALRRLP
ncbi:MAG: single-stranded-DNA-specific exonuclease RecJ [Clostridiales bacterium]|nr:single-stranded-DNA-specific exonuclease RecJ [Clostridiales bacterium]